MNAAFLMLVLAGAPARAAAPSPRDARDAARLERTLDALSGRMTGNREAFAEKTVGLVSQAAELARGGRGGPAARALAEEIRKAVREYRDETTGAAVAATLIARRLETYRRTGVLPPPSRDDGSIRRAVLSENAPATGEVAFLPLDLSALADRLDLPPPPRARGHRAPALPAPPPAIAARPARAPAAPLFMPDRGMGRPRRDPVPGLIADLSARDADLRALAADALGAQGGAAAPAVPALRQALSDADAGVRASSVAALGEIVAADSPAVADIRAALSDPAEDVRVRARGALKRLGLIR
jgi:hypothetical protein